LFWTRKRRKPGVVLSFRADGPYWSDLVHLLAYPDGINYVWPFRYDARLVESSLRAEFDTAAMRRALCGASILIGARFLASHTDKFLPIRRATIIQVDASAGIYSWLFRLGPAMDFVGAADLSNCAVDMTEDVDHLAFRDNLTPPLNQVADYQKLGASWKAFASLIVQESVLPINNDAKRSLFFHINPIRSAAGQVGTKLIFKSWSREDVFGFQLKEGQRYELKFSHYVPSLEGANTTIRAILIQPKLPATNIEPNTTQIDAIGNYGIESIILGAARRSETWEQLALSPTEKVYTAQNGQTQVISHEVKVPVRVAWSLWRWVWRTLLPAVLLFIALAMLGAANILDKLLAKLADGSLSWGKIFAEWPVIVLILVASGVASFTIPLLQARINPK
jgi:hypothetical protein